MYLLTPTSPCIPYQTCWPPRVPVYSCTYWPHIPLYSCNFRPLRLSVLLSLTKAKSGSEKKSYWKNISFWEGVVNRKIIQFSKASIPPRVHFSIHPFLQIILALNLLCGINSSDEICLQFCTLNALRTWCKWWPRCSRGRCWVKWARSWPPQGIRTRACPASPAPGTQLGQFYI